MGEAQLGEHLSADTAGEEEAGVKTWRPARRWDNSR